MDRGEYGRAVQHFLEALERKSVFPEVEMALGDVYRQGEPEIAERQYLKAYNRRYAFRVPEDRIEVLYRLVDLYAAGGVSDRLRETCGLILRDRLGSMSRTVFEYEVLGSIPSRSDRDTLLELYTLDADRGLYELDPDPSPEEMSTLGGLLEVAGYTTYYFDTYIEYRRRFFSTFRDRGLERLLVLYRIDESFAEKAHAELAELEMRRGNYARDENGEPGGGLEHYLFALVILLSDVIEEIRFWDPTYVFETLQGMFRAADRTDSLDGYLAGSPLYEYLYYLAVAAHGESLIWQARGEAERRAGDAGRARRFLDTAELYSGRAEDLWRILAAREEAGRYRNLSRTQLSAPRVEPLLYM